MEKYFNSYDAFFISEEFEGVFTDIEGNEIHGIISGASVMIAAIGVNKYTGQPEYLENKTNEICDGSIYNGCFDATIDAELGVLVIPNIEAIKHVEKITGLNIAGRITEYTIDIMNPKYPVIEPCKVKEIEFIRFIKEHFDKFNNSDNYYAQNTAYEYHRVETEYPRDNYMVGYDDKGNAVCYPYSSGKRLYKYFSSAKTKEQARSYVEILKQITPNELDEFISAQNSKAINEIMELIKSKEDKKDNQI